MTSASPSDLRDEPLWELVYGLLDDPQAAALIEQIRSDPDLARRYAEVCLQADLLRTATRLELPPLSFAPPQEAGPALDASAPIAAATPPRAARLWGWSLPAGWLAAALLLAVGAYRLSVPLSTPQWTLPVVEIHGPGTLLAGQPSQLELQTLVLDRPEDPPRPTAAELEVQVVDNRQQLLYRETLRSGVDGKASLALPASAVRPGAQLVVRQVPPSQATKDGSAFRSLPAGVSLPDGSLQVELPVESLQLVVRGLKERFEPGASVELEVEVTDAAGQPVSSAIAVQVWVESSDGAEPIPAELIPPPDRPGSGEPAAGLAGGAQSFAPHGASSQNGQSTLPGVVPAPVLLASNRELMVHALRQAIQDASRQMGHVRWRSGLVVVGLSVLVSLTLVLAVAWRAREQGLFAGARLGLSVTLLAAGLLVAGWGWRGRPEQGADQTVAMARPATAGSQQATPERSTVPPGEAHLARAEGSSAVESASLSSDRAQDRDAERPAPARRQAEAAREPQAVVAVVPERMFPASPAEGSRQPTDLLPQRAVRVLAAGEQRKAAEATAELPAADLPPRPSRERFLPNDARSTAVIRFTLPPREAMCRLRLEARSDTGAVVTAEHRLICQP